ncbi:MAG: hypothetical protein Q3994_07390 [Prevotella sp.]|nr:hypothetical protein [Prevotella sp.]
MRHNNSGIFLPVIAFDGHICGNWSPFKEEADASFFIEGHDGTNLKDAFEKYRLYKKKKDAKW